jgi:alcohol dehydrogenase
MTTFTALRVFEEEGAFVPRLVTRNDDELPAGEVLVQVTHSSLNYKDALSLSGNRGVTKRYPHTPGIDAAGTVISAAGGTFRAGTAVIVTGYDLGMNTDGGFGAHIRVPAGWVVPMPPGLDAARAMALGTAGLTAALCVDSLLQAGVDASRGEVLVTGATGGVGSVAVMLLAKLGFTVVAGSGKADRVDWLKSLGAQEILAREALLEGAGKPMLKERWAGVVDTVGGDILFNAVKSTRYAGSVAACGLVAAPTFNANVFPFILRGVNLLGVDSVELPLEVKATMWDLLAGEWALPQLESVVQEIPLEQVPAIAQELLAGRHAGRTRVRLS